MIGIPSMTADPTIRSAGAGDIPALMALNAHVQAWHAQAYPQFFRPQTEPEPLRAAFAEWIDDPATQVLISVAGVEPAGYVFTRQTDFPGSWHGTPFTRFEVEHIVVDPAHRGMGHGSALMTRALDAAPAGAQVTLTSWAANTGAHRFFARFGFAPQLIRFSQTERDV